MMRGAARPPLLPYDGGARGARGRGRRRYSLRQLLAFLAGGALCFAAVFALKRRADADDVAVAAQRAAAAESAYDADGAYVNTARPSGGGFSDGYKPDTVAADARAPDKPGDSPAVRMHGARA